MRSVYKALGYSIAGLVAVQAAAIAMWVFGMFHWVGDGKGSVTKPLLDDRLQGVTGAAGIEVHSTGAMVVALLAIVLLILSFFAQVPGGVKWAALLFLAVLLQWVFAIVAFGVPGVGVLHGLNALVVAWLGLRAAKQASVSSDAVPAREAAVV